MASQGDVAPAVNVEALVGLAQLGDCEAWATLCEHHYGDLVRSLGAAVRDRDDVFDLVHETFERARNALPGFSRRSSFRGWLVGVAYNVARDQRRVAQRRSRVRQRYAGAATLAVTVEDPEVRQARADAVRAVSSALDRLPDVLRRAFTLRYLEGLSLAGAAEVAGVTPTNMGVRAHRAKQRMRAELERAGWTVGQVVAV